jgi:hypothetical protein
LYTIKSGLLFFREIKKVEAQLPVSSGTSNTFSQANTSTRMSDQTLDKTINSNDLMDVTLVLEWDHKLKAHSVILATSSSTITNDNDGGFPCDKCDKSYPNEKLAKDLHMQRAHNIKSLQSTPGEKSVKTRPSNKCTSCSYTCKNKISMNKHIELFHKVKKETAQQAQMKRQLTSFTCPKCNSTFDNKYRMKNHMKEQHEGKHTLSPERKATKQFQEEVVTTKINLDGETITIPRQEQEHLQDMLVQT